MLTFNIPRVLFKTIAWIVAITFVLSSFLLSSNVYASNQSIVLPKPGTMVHLSVPRHGAGLALNPAVLKGIKVQANDPFRFEFVLNVGEASGEVKGVSLPDRQAGTLTKPDLKAESTKLIKYFLAAITTPEKDLWVNLSPYEKDRIVPESFGQTEMGRDLLAQDYLLKQLTASLIYPEDEIGKKFWKKVYEQTANKNVPINTFNKVWIVPNKAVVYENTKNGTAYVVESSLKVLTEQDYLANSKNKINDNNNLIVRDLVIPQLTDEVNKGSNFAQLRQVYNSLILAMWYKKKIKDSILSQVYADKNKIKGTQYQDSLNIQSIYSRYLESFKKGVFNYIKEDSVIASGAKQSLSPRKYFSGGVVFNAAMLSTVLTLPKGALNETGIRVAATLGVTDIKPSMMDYLKFFGANWMQQQSEFSLLLKAFLSPRTKTGRWTPVEFKQGWTEDAYMRMRAINLKVWARVYDVLLEGAYRDDAAKSITKSRNTYVMKLMLHFMGVHIKKHGWMILPKMRMLSKLLNPKNDNRVSKLQEAFKETSGLYRLNEQHDPRLPTLIFMRGCFEGTSKTFMAIFDAIQHEKVNAYYSELDEKNMKESTDDLISEINRLRAEYIGDGEIGFVTYSHAGRVLDEAREKARGTKTFQGVRIVSIAKPHGGSYQALIAEKWFMKMMLPLSYVSAKELIEAHDPSKNLAGTGTRLPNDEVKRLIYINASNDAHALPGEVGQALIAPWIAEADEVITVQGADHRSVVSDPETILAIRMLAEDLKGNMKKRQEELGGINLTPEKMGLEVNATGGEIKFKLDPALPDRQAGLVEFLKNAPGFEPVIISIQPMPNLRSFLEI